MPTRSRARCRDRPPVRRCAGRPRPNSRCRGRRAACRRAVPGSRRSSSGGRRRRWSRGAAACRRTSRRRALGLRPAPAASRRRSERRTNRSGVRARSARNSADGSVISCRPRSSIENTQISSTPPKRFLYARTMRYSPVASPSKYSTVSTRCSSRRGPAIAPSLVTWPTMKTAQPVRLANSISACVQSRTCETLPAYDSDFGQRHRLNRVDDDHVGRRAARSSSRTARRLVSGNTSRSSVAPTRAARNFICAADSSPHT